MISLVFSWLFRNSFICKNWLSLTQGDGKVERVIPVAGEEDLKNKNRLFYSWTRNKLFDDVSGYLKIVFQLSLLEQTKTQISIQIWILNHFVPIFEMDIHTRIGI